MLSLLGVLVWITCYITCRSGWIDPDTVKSAHSTASYVDGRPHKLVFSDEFNAEGRYFRDGEDPRWTSINKDDYTNYALHYYNHDLIRTSNGFLNITTKVEDVTFTYEDPTSTRSRGVKKTKNYQSGMLQGWNKFCFRGGIVEISVRLPGQAYIGGLWPAVWMMGNLARATYVGSSNNIWPWSYNKCSHGKLQHEQLFSACNRATHYGMHPYQGRGAPELDILEVMPGKEKLHGTTTMRPYSSASLQVAPGRSDFRPNSGEVPPKELWYSDHLTYGRNTSLNIYFYGMYLEGVSPDRSYLADALSANRNIEPTHFDEQHTYRVEWVHGPQGYLEWHLDGELVYRIEADALNATGAIVPEEPMYLLLNTAISSTWGFPQPCPAEQGCPCDCFDCRDLACACALPDKMCNNLPAHMLVDYVRVYQAEGDSNQTVGCSTLTHPTKKFIQAHPGLYKTKEDAVPLKDIKHGGGACVADGDCGADLPHVYLDTDIDASGDVTASDSGVDSADVSTGGISTGGNNKVRQQNHRHSGGTTSGRGECVRSKCQCRAAYYTGPHCLAYTGYDDVVWDQDPDLVVSFMVVPNSLIIVVVLGLALLVAVGVWKYKFDRDVRNGANGHAYQTIS